MIKLLKKSAKFAWDDTCQQSFDQLKQLLTTPPILSKPSPNLPLVVYISVSDSVVSAAIIQEIDNQQQPIYFIRRVLQDPETRYQMVERVALSLVTTARRLRPYFQSHPIIVRTDCPIQKILQKPDLAGRLSAWSIELSEFNIQYEPRGAIKAQCLADFTNDLQSYTAIQDTWWTMHVDGSSNPQGAGAGIVLEGPDNVLIEQSLQFKFKTSNNQAEYEAIIVGLHLSKEVGAKRLICKTDSRLTVGHLTGEYQVKDPLMAQYYHIVTDVISYFEDFKIEHVPRANNARADLLSKLASTKKKAKYRSLLQQTLEAPSIECEPQCMQITTRGTWMDPFIRYLQNETILEKEEKGWTRKAARYTLVGGNSSEEASTSCF